MPEKPFKPLLHRELHSHDAKEHYHAQIELLKDVVNYGTNMVPACFNSSTRNLGDIVVITVLLKQVVMMLDAFQILITEACTEAALLQCRALFEASIYLEWMLSSDAEKKALYYYVANVRREQMWVKRGIPGNVEQNKFFENLGEFGNTLEKTKDKLAVEAPSRLVDIEKFLANEPYYSVNAEFDAAKGSRPYDPAWYVPLGKRSVRSLATAVDRLHEYEIFYSQTSETMHASKHTSHIKMSKGHITFEPIRHLEGLSTNLSFSLSVVFHTYKRVLECYRPGQLPEFNKRYAECWREAFMNIPNVKYEAASNKTVI
jgi:hypothetical protein